MNIPSQKRQINLHFWLKIKKKLEFDGIGVFY